MLEPIVEPASEAGTPQVTVTGTTHTTLPAGAPSIPVAHASDQFAWPTNCIGLAPHEVARPDEVDSEEARRANHRSNRQLAGR